MNDRNLIDDRGVAEMFFDGDLIKARSWLKAYRTPRVSGMLIADDGKWVRAFGPGCTDHTIDDAYAKAPFKVIGHWSSRTDRLAQALADVENGAPVAHAAKRNSVDLKALHRKVKDSKHGGACPTCGRGAI